MTQTNEKAKALKHVRESCPELMELTRGCETQKDVYFIGIADDYGETWFVREDQIQYGQDDVFYTDGSDNSEVPIIGHTPHLEHWLRGIATRRQCAVVTDADEGTALFEPYRGTTFPYNLSKDGNNQSPEFYQAYNEITS